MAYPYWIDDQSIRASIVRSQVSGNTVRAVQRKTGIAISDHPHHQQQQQHGQHQHQQQTHYERGQMRRYNPHDYTSGRSSGYADPNASYFSLGGESGLGPGMSSCVRQGREEERESRDGLCVVCGVYVFVCVWWEGGGVLCKFGT